MTFRGPERIAKMVVIPDAHAHPAYSNDRFDWLGRFISYERPDVVLCLGDFADMASLSSYDKGKRSFEGRRYTEDVEATRDALAKLHRGWDCERWMTVGNHCARISRATNDSAELHGTLKIEDLGFQEYGWKVVPYQLSVSLGGFSASHHFAAGVSGRPIGGKNQSAALIRDLHMSTIVGHSHTLDYARHTRPDGTRINAIVAGCYTAPEQADEGWCIATAHMWWRGVVVLEGVERGDFGAMRLVTQDTIRELYAPKPAPKPKRPSARAARPA